jgi:WD40 repeat protein
MSNEQAGTERCSFQPCESVWKDNFMQAPMRLYLALLLISAAFGCASSAAAQTHEKGWTGVTAETVTPAMMTERKLAFPFGALVTDVAPEGPAANDLRTGDVILVLNGQQVQTAEAFISAAEALAPGSKAQLSVSRGREFLTPEITITAPPAPVSAAAVYPAVGDPLLRLDTGGHQAGINGLTFTPDGQFIVAAGDDKLIRVWDWQTGAVVRTLRGQSGAGPEGKIYAMALSPDGRWLAAGGWLGSFTGKKSKEEEEAHQIRLYDFASGELKALLKGHSNVVLGLAFSPDGKQLISGSSDNDAILWDIEAPSGAGVAETKLAHRLKGHRDDIYAVGFTADGKRAVTGSFDTTLRLWNAADGALLKELTGHRDKIFALAVSPKDGRIASGDNSGGIRLWDGATGTFLTVLAQQGGSAGSLRFSPDGHLLLSTCGYRYSGTCNHTQQIFDAASGQALTAYSKLNNIVLASAFSPDGRLVATGGGDNNEIHLWDAKTGETKAVLKGSGQTIWAAGFSADGNSIAWGNRQTQNDPRAGYGPLELALRLPGAGGALAAPLPLTSQEGWRRATTSHGGLSLQHRKGGKEGRIRDAGVLDILKDGKVAASIERGPADGYQHRAYSFSPDGQTVISGGSNGNLTAYSLDGKRLGDFIGHEGDVWAVAPSPDGKYLVSSADDQTVRLWNLQSREPAVTLFRGSDGEWVIYTPQGFYAASPGGAKYVTWQGEQGLRPRGLRGLGRAAL